MRSVVQDRSTARLTARTSTSRESWLRSGRPAPPSMSAPTALPVSLMIIEKNSAALEQDMRDRLGQQGLSYRDTRIVREIDVRYTMQMFEVSTPVPPGPIDQDVVEEVMTAFEERYAALYGKGTGFREAGLQAIT